MTPEERRERRGYMREYMRRWREANPEKVGAGRAGRQRSMRRLRAKRRAEWLAKWLAVATEAAAAPEGEA